ncbi:NAD(P)-dependent oxidoreductase [Thiomonas sp.]|jgi:3-hydroxyisobutyrate dehydrogenase-like beta-hydroxyacid dehydrogenase|uniref:NAD(P)-dependent oxidoreductase n=1 Tax=Thiomonas sp. TaxID=2047785 RepID=UPI00261AF048|nr:NAD(P)-dependent oxidoreductase [Thiomonas sp.]
MTLSDSSPPTATPVSTAFLGLGVMGDPMAGHLARAGHRVTVYNRTASKAHDWVRRNGGTSAPTPRQAAAEADFVFSCVGNDDDLRAVTLGPDGAFAAMRPGAVYVDHTTTSADVARELAQAARERGLWFIDAPVSGGQAGAQHGTLTVMCGGDAQAFDRARPVIAAYARAVTRLGDNGAGQLCKMVNQIAIAGVVQSLAEALAFGERAGLDLPTVLQVIGKGAAQSWQMDNRGPTMIEGRYDFGFAVDLMRKDFALCLNEARQNGARLPVLALVDQFYADVQAAGGGRLDTSSLLLRLRDKAR